MICRPMESSLSNNRPNAGPTGRCCTLGRLGDRHRAPLPMLTAWVLLCLLCSAAAGRDIFVNNLAGDDRFNGSSPENVPGLEGPVRTIARALKLARPGDRIVLANTEQPYRESVTLAGARHSGNSVRRFILDGNGATLSGAAPVPKDAWEHVAGAVFRFRPPHVAYQQLFLDGRPAQRVKTPPGADNPPHLEPLQWCLYRGHIYFSVDPNDTKLPGDYRLSYAHHQVGITLYHVHDVVIADLTVEGFQLDGINAANSARNVLIGGVTCRGNGRSGVVVGGASLVELDGCLLGDNGHAQLLTSPYSETHLRRTTLLGNTAPGWVDRGGVVYLHGYPNRIRKLSGGLDELFPPQPPAGQYPRRRIQSHRSP